MSRSTLPPPPDDVVPAPDDASTAAEQAQARAFGELLDKSLGGRTPPAMATSDRELLELATVIRAVTRPTELPDARAASIVEAALKQAVGVGGRPGGGVSITDPGIVALADRARPRPSRAPWIVAGASTLVAAAAVVMLVVGVGRRTALEQAPSTAARTAARVPLHWQSRPADELVGVIPHERSGDAGARIDAIYADRLDGYRELTLAGRAHRSKP
jgi:hypothetical protein